MTKKHSGVLVIAVVGLLSLATPVASLNVEKMIAAFKDTLIIPMSFYFQSKKFVGPNDGLQVIGAGLPRTGTQSIDAALRDLGHRVYRLDEIIGTPGHYDRWLQGGKEWKEDNNMTTLKGLVEEIEELGYTATLDIPMFWYAPALFELRPDAKVLMSLRDSSDRWVDSWIGLLLQLSFLRFRPWKWILVGFNLRGKMVPFMELFMENFETKETQYLQYPRDIARPVPWFEYLKVDPTQDPEVRSMWTKLYDNTLAEYKEFFPSEKILFYNVKQGWGPLVPFLGLDEKLLEEPFPNINDRKTLMLVRYVIDCIGLFLPLLIAFWGFVAYKIYKFVAGRRQTAATTSKVKTL